MPKKTLVIPPILNQDYQQVSVDLLKLHPRNVRQGDTGAIYESIEANGWYGVCVVQRSTNFVLAGNHRLLAARDAGLPAVPVVYVDVDDDRALRIMLADNGTNDKASNNESALAALLAELAVTDKGLLGTGFDGDDLDKLISDLANPLGATGAANDPYAEWTGMPEFEQNANEAYRSLIVHFDTPESVADFALKIGQDFSGEAKYIYHPYKAKETRGQYLAES